MSSLENLQLIGQFHDLKINPYSHIKIGEHKATLSNFCSLEVGNGAELILEDRVFFNNNCTIRCSNKIHIGKDTMFGDGVRIFDHNHEYSNYHVEKLSFTTAPITIGRNCWIGSNAVILKGVTIGDNVIIGANCLIYKDIPSHSIVTSQEELKIRKRPQAAHHVFTATASDTLEQLSYLVKELPQVNFNIAAQTSISPYLKSFNQYENVTLYTNVHHSDIFDDLLEQADCYLDINHWGEVDNIISKAHEKGKIIYAFDNVVHRSELTHSIFPHQSPEKMVFAIKKMLKI